MNTPDPDISPTQSQVISATQTTYQAIRRMIITGDTTQIDLPDPTQSGLIDAVRRLRRVRGVGFAELTGQDVVRHRLVQRIVEAYGADDETTEHGRALREAMHDIDRTSEGPNGSEAAG